jgi:hypothetical protein
LRAIGHPRPHLFARPALSFTESLAFTIAVGFELLRAFPPLRRGLHVALAVAFAVHLTGSATTFPRRALPRRILFLSCHRQQTHTQND